jgi:hypothetical protein
MLDIKVRSLERIEWKSTIGEGRIKLPNLGIQFFLIVFCDCTIVVFMIFIMYEWFQRARIMVHK